MKAAVFHEFGSPDVLRIEEVERQAPGPGELLVKVRAVGVNRLDHYLREGSMTRDLPLPHILGSDVSGVVETVGEDVHDFKEGDRVIPLPGYPLDASDASFIPMSAAPSYGLVGMNRPGGYAEYLTIPARWTVHDDTQLPFEEVAALPMVAVTAVRATKVIGQVKEGDQVAVHAGASGTGSMVIQVAKALGADVLATTRTAKKEETIRQAGADRIVNTRRENFVEAVHEWTGGRGADIVIDNLGGDVLPKSVEAIRPLGIVVTFGFVAGVESKLNVRDFFFGQKEIRGSLMGDADDLRWALDRVARGEIQPVLDRSMPLSDAADAHRLVAEGTTEGTIVLTP